MVTLRRRIMGEVRCVVFGEAPLLGLDDCLLINRPLFPHSCLPSSGTWYLGMVVNIYP